MVPYIHVPDLHIGPLPLHPFGILVATGVLVGTSITARRARKLGYDVLQLNSFVTWMLVSAFVLSHMLDSVFYHWDEVVRRPLSVIMLWEGLSSFGGFVGAVVGIVLWKYFVIDDDQYLPRLRRSPAPILPFADLVLSVFPIGWAFGRAGCSTVHDHPGARATADTLLAVAYPRHPGDGTVTKFGFIELIQGHDPRFDLGFLELLFTIILAVCFALTWRRRLPIGTYVIASGLAYAPVRFAMDFLRIPANDGGDTRYGSLTPAQWSCMVLFLYSLSMIFYVRSLQKRGIDLSQSLREPPPEASAGGAKAPA
ncbi:MAG TPA: prolipoprotein diacylglyceryl transferase family protein [Polyangiaceae bacterium]|jgi:phosphatidylglycerol:prolipoprotein diacylglycerol transferase|nr:prolipoprotein diacylglyceryl transferase family protein [Polyangiaceae bacterium]